MRKQVQQCLHSSVPVTFSYGLDPWNWHQNRNYYHTKLLKEIWLKHLKTISSVIDFTIQDWQKIDQQDRETNIITLIIM